MINVGNMRFLPHPNRPGVYVWGVVELFQTHPTWWEVRIPWAGHEDTRGAGPTAWEALYRLEQELADVVEDATEDAADRLERYQAAEQAARYLAGYRINLRTALFNEEPPL